MGNLNFEWNGNGDLADRLRVPVRRVSVRRIPNVGIVALTLWDAASNGVQIASRMHDVGDREEAGVLVFSSVDALDGEDEVLSPPPVLSGVHGLVKLVGSYDAQTTESGIVFEGEGLSDFVVASGVFPHTIAVSGLPGEVRFEPELDLETYERVPL
jgi:hypothetical protein